MVRQLASLCGLCAQMQGTAASYQWRTSSPKPPMNTRSLPVRLWTSLGLLLYVRIAALPSHPSPVTMPHL